MTWNSRCTVARSTRSDDHWSDEVFYTQRRAASERSFTVAEWVKRREEGAAKGRGAKGLLQVVAH